MKVEEFVYDVLTIAGQLSNDADISEDWVIDKMNKYRDLLLRQKFTMTRTLDPVNIQIMPLVEMSETNPTNDPSIILPATKMGTATIPVMIDLDDNYGLKYIGSASGKLSYTKIDQTALMLKLDIDEKMFLNMGYFYKHGNQLFIYPYNDKVKIIGVFYNPMEIPVFENGSYRERGLQDEYPIEGGLAQDIITRILSVDLAIKSQQIEDLLNDSQNQLKILRSGITARA